MALMQNLSAYLWGRLTPLGCFAAVLACMLDQVTKVWLLNVLALGDRGVIHLAPVLDLALTWNTGISYGLFQTQGPFGQAVLLAIKVAAVILLWAWLARASSRLVAVGLGLIIGGAIGNAIDRLAYGAVADFVLFHITTATWSFQWYVFNFADAAIVAGVALLLYESLFARRAAKVP